MRWSIVRLIWLREMRDQLRDRRTVFMIAVLPVLLYPIAVPVVIAGAVGTGAIFALEPDLALAQAWLSMLIFFDAVFLTLALWTFGAVMSE